MATIGRLPILELAPSVDGGAWPAKAFVGEVVPFTAVAFREGYGILRADLVLLPPDGEQTVHPMTLDEGFDRWTALAQVDREGEWRFRVQAYADDYATWLDAATKKVPAGVDVELVFAEGRALLWRAVNDARRTQSERRYLDELAAAITDPTADAASRLARAAEERLLRILQERPIVSMPTLSEIGALVVERARAGVGSWYELFPRSEGAKKLADGTWKSGTFRTAALRLPDVAAMGFDVVYLPPIHPIGLTHRKGRNNALSARPGDPGSPWAIGSADGGHDAIHPDLGSLADFQFFLGKAQQAGLEVALDLALQASPDHPWVSAHPEWFTQLSDGSIAYAENPPKQYQDIYPLNFDRDPNGLYAEVLRVVEHWIAQGVAIFRVDNPHTKPLWFWARLLAEVKAAHPEVVFLAEAFTRPAVMDALAKAGFQQSYSYFTWRNTKAELEEFLTGIAGPKAAYFRPNLFVNTPDILTEYLQFGGRPAFKVRAALAATAGASWGVYAGFELYESVARPGSEEYLDNEKYEFRPRDWARAAASGESLAPYLTILNSARREHPALRQLRNLVLHRSDDDAVLVFSKHLDGAFTRSGKSDTVIVVANVDPHSVRETLVHLDTASFGIAPGRPFDVRDLITGARWTWSERDYVRLDAFAEPVHLLHVRDAA